MPPSSIIFLSSYARFGLVEKVNCTTYCITQISGLLLSANGLCLSTFVYFVCGTLG